NKELRPGMTASGEIITDIREDVIGVPIQSVTVRTPDQLKKKPVEQSGDVAIAEENAESKYTPDKDGFVEIVFVVENGHVAAKQVKTGIQSDTH
ncbi:hypothetical protein GWO43_31155, partial [candidate division KSB1 bacterium]|nr:hypothetical protein [candidate division KSB1 bacterium]NIS28105.1 hypothetical protein [candidate division KSB1 bacterium]NIT75239.1 hypothetical protein [candidate division KSB1 bacterium]NIU93608.1 hypothetical protein [candidate division KSB1 bacterium]NIV97301.1 hypothetical protein [candidate division KSB1 bacterium]